MIMSDEQLVIDYKELLRAYMQEVESREGTDALPCGWDEYQNWVFSYGLDEVNELFALRDRNPPVPIKTVPVMLGRKGDKTLVGIDRIEEIA